MVIRDAEVGDGEALCNVISEWVRDPDTDEPRVGDIEDIIGAVEASAEGKSDRLYKVATIGGKVVGMVGMKPPDGAMRELSRTEQPAELVNMYVAGESRGGGVGKALVESLIGAANNAGHTELLVNSGPRYEKTAWGFYDKLFGKRLATLLDYYGKGIHAPVWRMDLSK
jgi:GNAT superfamily N-acetyltransferase